MLRPSFGSWWLIVLFYTRLSCGFVILLRSTHRTSSNRRLSPISTIPAGNTGIEDGSDILDPPQPAQSQWQLLQQLNATFDYEGRLPLMSTGQTAGDDHDDLLSEYRCGFVCIVGAPNMGKSTLLNALLEQDLSICTYRPQTTRHAILGILTTNTTQVCLVDTPGVIAAPAYKLQEGMMEAVTTAVRDADVLLIVTDIYNTPIPNDNLFAKVQRSDKPVLVAINKVDLLPSLARAKDKEQTNDDKPVPITIEEVIAMWRRLLPNAVAVLPVVAKDGPDQVGVVALRRILCGGPDIPGALRALGRPIPGMLRNLATENGASTTLYQDKEVRDMMLLPLSPPLYDQEALTDRTERFVASEIIRSALFETLKKELPYCCEVQVTEFKEPTIGHEGPTLIRISAIVVVERDSQKIIVIGKNGAQIKQIGVIAREKLEDFLQSQVFLTLNVKVNKDWRSNESQLKKYGYLS